MLNYVRGPSLFENLLTTNGEKCQVSKWTAKERELLELDNNIFECLLETVVSEMPLALQNLFAIAYDKPIDIRKLYVCHMILKEYMIVELIPTIMLTEMHYLFLRDHGLEYCWKMMIKSTFRKRDYYGLDDNVASEGIKIRRHKNHWRKVYKST